MVNGVGGPFTGQLAFGPKIRGNSVDYICRHG
jgi:hypothetical protein